MRVVVTGGAGFIGRAVVRRLREVGHDVRGIVRQPGRAAHLEVNGARLVRGDLSSVPELVDQLADAEGLVHAAGAYRIGIAESERAGMWDANVGVTERVLQAASRAGIQRIVYVSTNNVYGDTHGLIVDESYRRSIGDGFLSVYDESK
ncbi:MAG TPA: NAD-dependent epimerase/dehydratase family protein, partial [Candidatus Limnocylindrales bacterium]